MTLPKNAPIDIHALAKNLRAGSRAALARAITLIESRRGDHQAAARDLVQALLPGTGSAVRVGITGSPGVGKSTTIDGLGMFLSERGHKVAVLAVDPSSARTGGSILGDKTRMARLSASDSAFIRPSPASGTLGGVAAKTREAMLLCEAAGFDVVLVETVGIGQSETAVCDMTDFFLALMLPGAGDELQGIKKGLVELADMIAVNKADGDNVKRANLAAAEYGCLRRIRRATAAATGKMDVVDAGAADDGTAARRSLDPRQGEENRVRGGRRPHHPGTGGGADRGDAEVK
jgi:LAO/AO transport system kinase